jgi:hypothetical protein
MDTLESTLISSPAKRTLLLRFPIELAILVDKMLLVDTFMPKAATLDTSLSTSMFPPDIIDMVLSASLSASTSPMVSKAGLKRPYFGIAFGGGRITSGLRPPPYPAPNSSPCPCPWPEPRTILDPPLLKKAMDLCREGFISSNLIDKFMFFHCMS